MVARVQHQQQPPESPRGVPAAATRDPVADPHCRRSSNALIGFAVDGEEWDVLWGEWYAFGAASYWINQTVRGGYVNRTADMARNADIRSETIFCLLGGFGVTAESALTAHKTVLTLLDDEPCPHPERIEVALRAPAPDGSGRYRFPHQRAQRVAAALDRLAADPPPTGVAELRQYLLTLNGVGPKTASWIVRNVTGDSSVAIIDIWLIRALTASGIFSPKWRVDRHYDRFDSAFTQYAHHGNVAAGALDLCIWDQARTVGHTYWQTHPTSRRARH